MEVVHCDFFSVRPLPVGFRRRDAAPAFPMPDSLSRPTQRYLSGFALWLGGGSALAHAPGGSILASPWAWPLLGFALLLILGTALLLRWQRLIQAHRTALRNERERSESLLRTIIDAAT